MRQIEEFALAQLSKAAPASAQLQKAIAGARDLMSREGGVARERSLFKTVSGAERDSVANASLAFALTLDRELVRVPENDRFQAFWATTPAALESFKSTVSALVSALEAHGGVMTEDQLCDFARGKNIAGLTGSRFDASHLALLSTVSKDIGRNIFGEVGLSHWNQIRPKGVRDKAYLVMKKAGKPQHFSAIAKLINVAKFDAKKTNVQTVHNELIKDSRFVLVGRGMYALAEWGYKSGTVKDVLTDILKTHGKPLARADLIARVGAVRLVKENTILLNLQDSATFVRDADGNYRLRRG